MVLHVISAGVRMHRTPAMNRWLLGSVGILRFSLGLESTDQSFDYPTVDR
jgi:hypothetical protein